MDFKRFSKDCRIALTEWLLCCNMVVTEKQVRSAKIKNGGKLMKTIAVKFRIENIETLTEGISRIEERMTRIEEHLMKH